MNNPSLKTYFLIILSCIFCCCSSSSPTSNHTFSTNTEDFTSEQTGDTYSIHITLPKGYSKSKQYPVLYYADATLKSGNKTRAIAEKLIEEGTIKSCILVGIGHYGDYRMKRRRDYIQAHKKDKAGNWYSDETNYGHSLKFYQFLQKELIPYIEKNYSTKSTNRTFLGHSLSGLFCAYAMLQDDLLFENYIALSPSIWANYQNLFPFERLFYANGKELKGNLLLTAGGLEVANLVLYNVNQYHIHINKRNYEHLNMEKNIYSGKTHMTALDQGIEDGLKMMLGK